MSGVSKLLNHNDAIDFLLMVCYPYPGWFFEKGRQRVRILATNTDMGGVGAMLPVLKLLQSQGGHEVTTLAEPASRGFAAFKGGGFEPLPFESSPNYDDAMEKLLLERRPKVVVVGIASGDQGTEKSVLRIGPKLGIPVVVIVETWPNEWLYWHAVRNPGRGEVDLYNKAMAICVPDGLAVGTMMEYGFDKAKIFATGNPEWDLLAEFRSKRDKYRNEMRGKWGIEEDKFVVLFATTNKLDDPTEDVPGAAGWFGVSEKDIIRECLEAVRGKKVRLVIRQKPGWPTETVTKLMAEIPCGAVLDTEPYERGWPAVLAADVVVGLATLVLQNAALLGVPAVSYQPGRNPSEDSFSPNKIGITLPIYEHGSLGGLISRPGQQLLAELQALVARVELIPNATGRVCSLIQDFGR